MALMLRLHLQYCYCQFFGFFCGVEYACFPVSCVSLVLFSYSLRSATLLARQMGFLRVNSDMCIVCVCVPDVATHCIFLCGTPGFMGPASSPNSIYGRAVSQRPLPALWVCRVGFCELLFWKHRVAKSTWLRVASGVQIAKEGFKQKKIGLWVSKCVCVGVLADVLVGLGKDDGDPSP
ncbi:hypothetical protein F5884DRAFT_286282 [Xylogone sp. PMI_703]|nr:hypothetical protein F5884DRAFT_286282 [Xylogone sp. PMI_703]